jgi:putative redox protein
MFCYFCTKKNKMVTIEVKLASPDFGFDGSDASGHVVKMDTSTADGGKNYGVSPMQSLLVALGGCSGIDIVGILKKKKQAFTTIAMTIKGTREPGKLPSLWQTIHIQFAIGGNVDRAKAEHAITLSIDKYCSVAETLRRSGSSITWTLDLIDK